jgi:hypothetical protein
MPKVFPDLGAFIRVDGVCYQRTTVAAGPPDTGTFQGEFNTCESCCADSILSRKYILCGFPETVIYVTLDTTAEFITYPLAGDCYKFIEESIVVPTIFIEDFTEDDCTCNCGIVTYPSSLSISFEIQYRTAANVPREIQILSGTLTNTALNTYGGTLSRNINDYDGSGSLCGTRSTAGVYTEITFNETLCRWEYSFGGALSYIEGLDPIGTWTAIPSGIVSAGFICSPSPDNTYIIANPFVVS